MVLRDHLTSSLTSSGSSAGARSVTAARGLTTPEPVASSRPAAPMSTAVFSIWRGTWYGLRALALAITSAATPVTYGADIEVPSFSA